MRKKLPKRELTLMTLLANEATKDSRKLLKKYNRPDAKDYADLEVKLAELYTASPDKFALEQEMAAIHPHKNWLIKRLELDKPKEIAVKEESIVEPMPICNNPYCPVHGKIPVCQYSNATGSEVVVNNPFASTQGKPNTSNQNQEQTPKSPTDYIGLIGIVAIVGMTFYVLTKTVK